MSEPANLLLEYRDDCLVIRFEGRAMLEKTSETVQAVAAAIRARAVRATLVDVRAVPGPISFLNRYQLGEMAGRYLPRGPLACLMLEEQSDPRRIGQLAAKNRGVHIEVFTDPAAAERWLKKTRGRGSRAPMGSV